MLPAGRYYVGDLCYVVSDARWDGFVKRSFPGNERSPLEGEFLTEDGARYAMYSTSYGDGVYFDQNGGHYPVDSGSLGCLPVEACDPELLREAVKRELGHVVKFPRPFQTSGCAARWKPGEGVVKFGLVAIDTCPEEDDEQEGVKEDDA